MGDIGHHYDWIVEKTQKADEEDENDQDEDDQDEEEQSGDLIPEGVMCTETFLHADEMSRVINGAEVVPNSWNWYAYFFGCGGTILSREWIVTAAHCGVEVGDQVAVGFHDDPLADSVQIVKVLEVIEHKSYKSPHPNSNDIAVVRVEPITFDGKTVNPACIQKDTSMFEGKRCYAGGMGLLNNEVDEATGQLKPVEAENVQSTSLVIGGGKCDNYNWNEYPEILCAGDDTNQDVCRGDSGGPLVCIDEKNQPILVGAVTGGDYCLQTNGASGGIYADIGHHYDWIVENTQKNGDQGEGWKCESGSGRNFGELFANKPCEVPEELCPEKGKLATWSKKVARIMYKSNLSMMIKINVPVKFNTFVKDNEYIGFIQFPKRVCGKPFIRALTGLFEDENDQDYYFHQSWIEIFDYENTYHYQYRHFRDDGIHSAGVIQFYRRLSDRDLGNDNRDSFFLSISGLNDFDFGEKNLEECINGLYIGAMRVDENISGGLEANLAGCAARDKDLGYKGRE